MKIWLVMALGALLTACGPSYYLTVQPTDLEGQAKNAPQTLLAEVEGVEMELTFSHFRIKDLAFKAEIRNGSTEPVLVDPAQFYYLSGVAPAANAKAEKATSRTRVKAYDPEAEQQPLTTRLSMQEGVVMGVSELEWLLVMASASKEAMAKARIQTKQIKSKGQENTEPQLPGPVQEQVAGDKIAEELELWQGKLLRKYTLQPGELIRGYVVFPKLKQKTMMRVTAPVGPHVFTFDFNHKWLTY